MNTAMSARNRTRWTAGTIAALASLLTVGGPLMLAEHYAQAGVNGQASGYYATEQTRRNAPLDSGNVRAAAASPQCGTQRSRHGATV